MASPGCGTPETLLRTLGERAESLGSPMLYSGLQLGTYPFLDAVQAGHLGYATWHVLGPARAHVRAGTADYLPVRASEVPHLLPRWGVNAAFVRVTPPDRNGYVSLGPSVSYPYDAVRLATCVVGEVDPDLPRTFGASNVHVSRFDSLVDADGPACQYQGSIPSPIAKAIAAHVIDLLPERPTLQVGIGEIPEALVASLGDADLGPLRFVGMGTDEMVPLLESGAIDPDALVPDPGIATVELMGSRRLLDAADLHPAIGVYPSTRFHTPRHLLALDRLVSINSAVEIDLHGQVNAETVRGHQVSGVGGSIDFVEGAYGSDGGLRILALSSTTRDGRHSRIVPILPAGAAVTIPRALADVVVTEHGVADLRGRTLRERADALVAIAHPDLRDDLANASAPPTEEPR